MHPLLVSGGYQEQLGIGDGKRRQLSIVVDYVSPPLQRKSLRLKFVNDP
jgi:hypothetical protein